MNLKEYEKKLRELTHEELHKFNADFGGERTEIDQRVRDFVDYPDHPKDTPPNLLNTTFDYISSATWVKN